MSGYAKEIGAGVVLAVILAAAMGAVAVYSFPSAGGTESTSIASRALPCGSQGVYCGRPEIQSATLATNGSASVLQIKLAEVGNDYIGSAIVYVNGSVIGVPPSNQSGAGQYGPPGNIILNVTSGNPAVLVLVIPNSTISVHAGATYSVMVYGWLGPPGQAASAGDSATVNVKAETALVLMP